jgi:hypothetical protein
MHTGTGTWEGEGWTKSERGEISIFGNKNPSKCWENTAGGGEIIPSYDREIRTLIYVCGTLTNLP